MFQELLERIALELEKEGILYMIIGGQAVLLHGEPRLTRDIDITLGATVEKLDAILRVAAASGLEPLVDPETFPKETMVLPCQHGGSDIRVDFIFSFSPYEQQALQRVRKVRIGKADVRFAAVEDLIVHKMFAGRPRDLEDVKAILAKNPEADVVYIRQWLKEFTKALEEPYLERFNTLYAELFH